MQRHVINATLNFHTSHITFILVKRDMYSLLYEKHFKSLSYFKIVLLFFFVMFLRILISTALFQPFSCKFFVFVVVSRRILGSNINSIRNSLINMPWIRTLKLEETAY